MVSRLVCAYLNWLWYNYLFLLFIPVHITPFLITLADYIPFLITLRCHTFSYPVLLGHIMAFLTLHPLVNHTFSTFSCLYLAIFITYHTLSYHTLIYFAGPDLILALCLFPGNNVACCFSNWWTLNYHRRGILILKYLPHFPNICGA